MLYAHSNLLRMKKSEKIRHLTSEYLAGRKCFLIFVEMIDDKEIGSPG